MKVAVTGATGGLGRSLVESLLERGVSVVAVGRNRDIGRDLSARGANFVSCEIGDVEALASAFAGCDQVVHSAGLASPWGPWEDFERINVGGTRAVLEAISRAGVRKLIHVSTPSVYFAGDASTNVRESDPIPAPTNFYAKSKMMADELVRYSVATTGLSVVLVRPRSIYGKYDRTILPRMSRVMARGFFPLPDGGGALVDVTAVDNVVHFIWLCLSSDRQFRGDAYNVTNGEPMPVREMLAIVAEASGANVKFVSVPSWFLYGVAAVLEFLAKHVTYREPMLTHHSVQSIAVTQTLSIEKARTELGYSPIVRTRESIQRLFTH